MPKGWNRAALVAVLAVGIVTTLRPLAEQQSAADAEAAKFYIVDCLLPGQVRRVGNTTYMTPRRPIRTTAQDCAIRGGEYTEWDRADYQSALTVWLDAASTGDAQAMNYVGEIFEQGLGRDPDYVMAKYWYERAVAADFKPAMVNLASLYDTGRGVDRDAVMAINLYRQAWGIPEGEALLTQTVSDAASAEAESALAAVRAENEQLVAAAEAAREALQSESDRASALAARAENAEAERDSLAARFEDAPVNAAGEVLPVVSSLGSASPVSQSDRDYGRYFALVIGNSEHQFLSELSSAKNDARRVSEVLVDRYGFEVTRIDNADNISVLAALNQLHETLGPNDNLLIYYAGYGNERTDEQMQIGYWLPVNAQRPPIDTYWVPVGQIGAHLARLPARRVLVIADSSFSGLLADTPTFFLAVSPDLFTSERYLDIRHDNRSRLLISSGQDYPLPDQSGDQSIFADAVLDALEENDAILPAPALFLAVRDQLDPGTLDVQFKAIKGAGDAVGDFYFVPRK
jgi:hypothetical protein